MKPETALEAVLAPDQPRSDAFRVDSLAKALWATRKLQIIRRKEAEAKAEAQAQIALITDWLQGVTDECAQEARYFEGLLAPWVLEQIADSKKKSVKLPGATLGYRSGGTALVYDEAALLAWAKTYKPELVRTKEEVNRSAVKDAVLKDGEILRDDAGQLLIVVEEKPDTFYVKISDASDVKESDDE